MTTLRDITQAVFAVGSLVVRIQEPGQRAQAALTNAAVASLRQTAVCSLVVAAELSAAV